MSVSRAHWVAYFQSSPIKFDLVNPLKKMEQMDSQSQKRPAQTDERVHFAASNNRKSDFRALAKGSYGPFMVTRTFFSYKVCTMLLFAAAYCFSLNSALDNFTFSVLGTLYDCSSNMICIGEAHVYTEALVNTVETLGIQTGRLSLLSETYNISAFQQGLAYYKDPVQLLDRSCRQPASFTTSFTVDMRWGHENGSSYNGDGMAFVISADSSTPGGSGEHLGIFDMHGKTAFKSVVVEFDTYCNPYYPVYDISANHVSLDLKNTTWVAAVNTSDLILLKARQITLYAWVEYSNPTQQLEVRISPSQARPTRPLLNYTINLYDFLDEYMWIGFSSGAGNAFSNYYIGDWTFVSWFEAGSPVPSSEDKNSLGMILGICVGVPAFLIGFCIVVALFLRRPVGRSGHRRWQRRLGLIDDDDILEIEGMPERFTYKQLSQATGNFSEQSKLGQGGFGSVYRGVLPSSLTPVAVKKISSDSAQGEKEFMAEVSIISQLRHRNLIQLLGWCKDATRERYLLVYELMPNGSLDKVLFPAPVFGADLVEHAPVCLTWEQRFNVVTGTAAALEYLHQGWKQQVIHRDIKSSNIMLDDDWNAKLGDFGLARLVDHQHEATTTGVAGTYGYIAPEAAVSGHFTEKSDVYAFGAVILEVACGRRAFLSYVESGEIVLVDWVWQSLSEGNLLRTVDKRLVEYDAEWMEVILIIGLLCSHPDPLARPSMKHVVQVLDGVAPVPSIPISKPPSSFYSAALSRRTNDSEHDLTWTRTTGSNSLLSGSISINISDSTLRFSSKSRVNSPMTLVSST